MRSLNANVQRSLPIWGLLFSTCRSRLRRSFILLLFGVLIVIYWVFALHDLQREWVYNALGLRDRRPCHPLVTGDAFRALADHICDETGCPFLSSSSSSPIPLLLPSSSSSSSQWSHSTSGRRLQKGDIVFVKADLVQQYIHAVFLEETSTSSSKSTGTGIDIDIDVIPPHIVVVHNGDLGISPNTLEELAIMCHRRRRRKKEQTETQSPCPIQALFAPNFVIHEDYTIPNSNNNKKEEDTMDDKFAALNIISIPLGIENRQYKHGRVPEAYIQLQSWTHLRTKLGVIVEGFQQQQQQQQQQQALLSPKNMRLVFAAFDIGTNPPARTEAALAVTGHEDDWATVRISGWTAGIRASQKQKQQKETKEKEKSVMIPSSLSSSSSSSSPLQMTRRLQDSKDSSSLSSSSSYEMIPEPILLDAAQISMIPKLSTEAEGAGVPVLTPLFFTTTTAHQSKYRLNDKRKLLISNKHDTSSSSSSSLSSSSTVSSPPSSTPAFLLPLPLLSQLEPSHVSYLQSLAEHIFTLSPPGNGLQAHRTWEALHAGSIPILKRTYIRTIDAGDMFLGLPVLLVHSWSDVTKRNVLRAAMILGRVAQTTQDAFDAAEEKKKTQNGQVLALGYVPFAPHMLDISIEKEEDFESAVPKNAIFIYENLLWPYWERLLRATKEEVKKS